MYEQLFQRFQATDVKQPSPPYYVNWLGIETDARLFPHGPQLEGRIISEMPLGHLGDNVYGGPSEYGSLLSAVEQTSRDGLDSLNVVELGAGWGPWISAAGVAGKKLGFKSIKLVGVEADEGRFDLMREHMARNGLDGDASVSTRLLKGAAWKENTTLRFGSMSSNDHGGAASAADSSEGSDYRGFQVPYTDVEAYDLATICEGMDRIDYMHWDVQGAELEIAEAGIGFMNERVARVFIGTHSPLIDGQLLELLFRHQWDIMSFDPCPIKYDRTKASVQAMALRDGEIFAVNPRLT